MHAEAYHVGDKIWISYWGVGKEIHDNVYISTIWTLAKIVDYTGIYTANSKKVVLQ